MIRFVWIQIFIVVSVSRSIIFHEIICSAALVFLIILWIILFILIWRAAVFENIFLFTGWTLILKAWFVHFSDISLLFGIFWREIWTFALNSRSLVFRSDTSFCWFIFLLVKRILIGVIYILFRLEFGKRFISINCVSFTKDSILRDISFSWSFIFFFITKSTVIKSLLNFFIFILLGCLRGWFFIFGAW